LLLSIASIWELMIKQGLGKLRLRHDVRTMVTRDLTQNRLILLHVTPDHLWMLDTLPQHHRDPFDRLLVAQTKVEGLTLVSNDAEVAKYDVNRLW
jgi:PIN domain nuclease of toxin-antitoxin system